MVKIITMVISLILSTLSFSYSADDTTELTLIRGGSDTGTTAQRSNLYQTSLEGKGYTINRPSSMPDKQLAKFFHDTDKPVIWPGISDYGSRMELDFDSENIVAIEFTGFYFICYIGNKTDPKEIKLGVSKSAPKVTLKKLGYDTTLPYKNNGAVVNAAIAGEVDAVISNQQGAKKLKSAGLRCDEFSGFNQVAFLLARNIPDIEQLREDVASVLVGPDFVEWQTRAGLTNNLFTGDADRDYKTVRDSWDTWADKEQ